MCGFPVSEGTVASRDCPGTERATTDLRTWPLHLTLREGLVFSRGHETQVNGRRRDGAGRVEGGGAGGRDGAHRAHAAPLRRDRAAQAVAPYAVGAPPVRRGRRRAAAAGDVAAAARAPAGADP